MPGSTRSSRLYASRALLSRRLDSTNRRIVYVMDWTPAVKRSARLLLMLCSAMVLVKRTAHVFPGDRGASGLCGIATARSATADPSLRGR